MQLELFNFDSACLPQIGIIESITKNIKIHEFQAGVIYAYKDLKKLVRGKHIFFLDNNDFVIKQDYYSVQDKTEEEINVLLSTYKHVNTFQHFPSLKPVKRCEVTYLLSEVFNKFYYKNSKKYYQRVTNHLNKAIRDGLTVRELTTNDVEESKILHQRWLEYKLENYNLFRIMFPEKRYVRCLESSFEKEINGCGIRIRTVGLFDNSNTLLGYRTIYIIEQNAYDLAYITNRESDISNLSELFEIITLKHIKDNYDVEFFNCGLSDGKLKLFKKKLPNHELYYYQYKKL